MAQYTIAGGAIASLDNQLTANTVDTVTVATDTELIEVQTDGTAAIYFTLDGSTPTVSGSNCHKLLPVEGATQFRVPPQTGLQVNLISTGTPVYSVTIVS